MFFDSARAAFRALLDSLPTASSTVLLPAFVGQSTREGSGVLDPVRSLNLEPCFYDVNPDVTANLDDFVKQLARVKPRAALVVHYYGRADPNLPTLASACGDAGVPLVEDAAHGLLSAARGGSAIGRRGDATIYSLHKMLPIPEGGMLSIRNPALKVRTAGVHDALATTLLSYDLIELGEIRRRHFERYRRALGGSSLLGQAYDLPWEILGRDVPQSFPVLLRGVNRDRLYHVLNGAGVGVVSLYHTLVPEVAASPDVASKFGRAMRLSRSIINLPLHQDLSPQEIDAAADAFSSAVRDALGDR